MQLRLTFRGADAPLDGTGEPRERSDLAAFVACLEAPRFGASGGQPLDEHHSMNATR